MSTHYKLLLGSALSVIILGGCASGQLASRVSALEERADAADRQMSDVHRVATNAQNTANKNAEAIRHQDSEHDSDMEKMRMMDRKMGHMKMKMRDHMMKDDDMMKGDMMK